MRFLYQSKQAITKYRHDFHQVLQEMRENKKELSQNRLVNYFF